jgi:hypothetical protein
LVKSNLIFSLFVMHITADLHQYFVHSLYICLWCITVPGFTFLTQIICLLYFFLKFVYFYICWCTQFQDSVQSSASVSPMLWSLYIHTLHLWIVRNYKTCLMTYHSIKIMWKIVKWFKTKGINKDTQRLPGHLASQIYFLKREIGIKISVKSAFGNFAKWRIILEYGERIISVHKYLF